MRVNRNAVIIGLLALAAALALPWRWVNAQPAPSEPPPDWLFAPLPTDPPDPPPADEGPAVRRTEHSRVELIASQDAVRPGDRLLLAVRFQFLQPGLHAYGYDLEGDLGVATRVEPRGPAAFLFGRPVYPPSTPTERFGLTLAEYHEDFTVFVPVQAPEELPGEQVTFEMAAIYQVCGETTCFDDITPRHPPLALTLPVRPAGAAVAEVRPDLFAEHVPPDGPEEWTAPVGAAPAALGPDDRATIFGVVLTASDWPLALLFALVVGALLNLTPCVLPVIPLTVGFFVYQSQQGGGGPSGRGRLLLAGGTFALGLVAAFAVLGATVVLASAQFGELFTRPGAIFGLGLFIVVMAMGMFGVYPIQLPAFIGRASGGRQGFGGAFVMGVLAAVLSTPCTGPVIGGMLGWVGLVPPVLGLAAFVGMGLGMASPYVLLTGAPGLLDRVPRSGRWTETVKIGLGIVLLGLGLLVLDGLAANQFRYAMWAGLAVSAAVWIAAGLIRRREGTRPVGWLWLPRLAVLGLAVGTSAAYWPPPEHDTGAVYTVGSTTWYRYEPGLLEQAEVDARPVMLDFVTNSCANCKIMDRRVWPTEQAADALRGIQPIKANLDGPHRAELLGRFTVQGVPTLVFLDGRGQIVHTFFGFDFFADADGFAEAMKPVRQALGLDP